LDKFIYLNIMAVDLSIEIAGKQFNNPIWTASGTCGYGEELSEYFPLKQLGAIITKSITLDPRKGHPPPRVFETSCGMLNAIGLQNVGLDDFVSSKIPFLKNKGANIIVNVAGNSIEEYKSICERLSDYFADISLIELNMSCPNVVNGMEYSKDPKAAELLVREVKKSTAIPIIAKLSPNVSDIAEIASAVEQGGADAISMINTLIGMAVDVETFVPRLSNITGGLSGPAIKPVAVAMVYRTYKRVNIPIVGIGGISDYRDVIEFMLCGASAVQVGTANFINPLTAVEIISDIGNWLGERGYSSPKDIIGKVRDK